MRDHQLKGFMAEIEKRGGETTIEHMPYGKAGWRNTETRSLEVLDSGKSEGLAVHVLGCEGWRYYSRRFGARLAKLRYLVGKDDSGLWAVRLPGSVDTVAEAVDFITPALVQKARRTKCRVLRQGNLYLVESPRARNHLDMEMSSTYGSHEYYRNARIMLHPEHAPMRVPAGRWQACEQKALETQRGGASD